MTAVSKGPSSVLNVGAAVPVGSKVVFVKFTDARYELVFDVGSAASDTGSVTSTIVFDCAERGFPVIDLYTGGKQQIDSVDLDGTALAKPETAEVAFPGAATVRILLREIDPGEHTVIIKHRLALGVDRTVDKEVFASFDMMDKPEVGSTINRDFLERYLPANLEFDQHLVTLDVKVVNGDAAKPHRLFTNGVQVPVNEGRHWIVAYPEWHTSSSPFFVLAPANNVTTRAFTAGPVLVELFSVDAASAGELAMFEASTLAHIAELAAVFGPFPFPKLVLWATQDRGMEYAGAAAVSLGSLKHELVHQYVGRCLLPANGDAGWFDEGVASWYEFGSLTHANPPLDKRNMGGQSDYRRLTDEVAWMLGKSLVGWLNGQLPNGGIGGLVAHLIGPGGFKFKTLTAKQFQDQIELYAKKSFQAEFDRCVYGK